MSEHRGLNSRLQGDRILELDPINIGVAIETEHTLLVPVIKSADSLGIEGVSEELVRLRQAIAAGSITADDLTGGTFTVINLGLFGVGAFTPIVNALEIGILGIGRIRRFEERAVTMPKVKLCFWRVKNIGLMLRRHGCRSSIPYAYFMNTS